MNARCPECGEWTVVCLVEPVGTVARVSHVTPPPYCPMCGYAWWREGLAEEAGKVIERG